VTFERAVRSGLVACGMVLLTFCTGADQPLAPSVGALAGPPAKLTIVSGNNQSGIVNTQLAKPLVVKVTDLQNRAVANVSVTFSVSMGNGRTTPLTAKTNSQGQVSSKLTLGTIAGLNQVTVTSGTIPAKTFTATGNPGPISAFTIVSGNGQTGAAGGALADSIVVKLADAFGNGVSGKPVSFSVTTGNGIVSPVSVPTGSSGTAATAWTLSPSLGAKTATARFNTRTLQFTATSIPGSPGNLTILGGQAQSGLPGTLLPVPLKIRVTDGFSNPTPQITVNFTVVEGAGALSAASIVTGTTGEAEVSWTLGPQTGSHSVSATVTGVPPALFTASAVAGPPSLLTIISGNNQIGTVGTQLAQPIVVRLTDAGNNPLAGISIGFAAIAGGTIAPASILTDAQGQASAQVLLGTASGTFQASATAEDLPPVGITATAAAGTATSAILLRGGGQSATVFSPLPESVVARLEDQYGNPVPSTPVSFLPTGLYSFTDPMHGRTDAEGVAATRWTLGGTAGTDTLHVVPTFQSLLDIVATTLPGPPVRLIPGTTDSLGAIAGNPLGDSISVRVTDSVGNAVPGVAVSFTVTAGGGSASPVTTVTDAGGFARTWWTLGAVPGHNELVSSAASLSATNGARGVVIAPISRSIGWLHGCTLDAGGQARCWGFNQTGQLGDGTQINRTSSVAVGGGQTFVAITTGAGHSCGLTAEGKAYCWGANSIWQLGDSTTTNHLTPHPVHGTRAYVSIAAGGAHTCAVGADGYGYCWGNNSEGQIGDAAPIVPRKIPKRVANIAGLVAVDAGDEFSCALGATGKAWCWGSNIHGQIGDGSFSVRPAPSPVAGGITFASLEVGVATACGLTQSGSAFCWGANNVGQMGDGTLQNRPQPTPINGIGPVSWIGAGIGHTCATSSIGEAFCWGANGFGQLGTGNKVPTLAPVPVATALRFEFIGAADQYTCGFAAGQGYCWGVNNRGQLGDGTLTMRLLPTPMAP
jgi:alpha-tubulin suppressor-like RCC1 family protein